MARRPGKWTLALLAISVTGLAVRVAYVIGWKSHFPVGGDAFYYHAQANLLASGHLWVDPYSWRQSGSYIPSAAHPPLYSTLLGVGSLVGLRSALSHQVISCYLGAAAIPLLGLAGRLAAGSVVGLVAAVVAAVYPGLWINDGQLLSEGLAITTSSLVIWLALRLLARPTLARAGWLGAGVAVAALARAELVLLVVALVPLVTLRHAGAARRGVLLLATSTVVTAGVLAPWLVFNAVRFVHPVTLSSQLDATLVVSNCPTTYEGGFRGWWDYSCLAQAPPVAGDESQQAIVYRQRAETFVKAHQSEVPGVVAARLGRVWGVYRIGQQLILDQIEGRNLRLNRIAWACYAVLGLLGVVGVLVRARAREPLGPLLAGPVVVCITASITYGTTRFRAPAEPAIVLAAAIAIGAVASVVRRLGPGSAGAQQPSLTVPPRSLDGAPA